MHFPQKSDIVDLLPMLLPTQEEYKKIDTSVSVAVGHRSGDLLSTTFVSHYFHHSFLFPSQPFLIGWLVGSKKLFHKSGRECPKTYGYPFTDIVVHFWPPWLPFWIFEVLIEGSIESKNLFGPLSRKSAPFAAWPV